MKILSRQQRRHRRHKSVRRKVFGTHDVPRVSVYRSNKHIYAQLIDDEKGITLLSISDLKSKSKVNKTQQSLAVGKELGKKAKSKRITRIRFDRGGYKYHGRVKALAEGLRESGIKF